MELEPRDSGPRPVWIVYIFLKLLSLLVQWWLRHLVHGATPVGTSGFIRPIAGSPPISDDFNEHKARGSVNPGTDYAVASGTPVVASAAGTIMVADTGTGGAGGRTIVIYFDGGWSADYLHLKSLSVGQGAHVSQGQLLGYSGSSANGSETGVGAHLHQTMRSNQTTCYCNSGNVDGELYFGPVQLSPTQRQVKPSGPEVLRRVTPDTSQPDIDPDLQPGEVGNFNGWIRGENVNGIDMWYRGVSGNWFWAGGFTEVSGHDLQDLNPVTPPGPGERQVLSSAAANIRNASNTGATVTGSYPAGSKQTFTYWQKGEAVSGNDTWYVDSTKTKFSWSGGFTSQSKDGLTELAGTGPVPPTWPSTPYDFQVAGSFVTRKAPAHWSNFENEYSVPNAADRKGFPDDPTAVVDHQWGNPGDYTISSVINTFQARHDNPNDRVSSHFVVNATEIVQMVSLDDRAYHAGSGGNDYVGIEIDPYIGDPAHNGQAIIDNTRKILEFLRDRHDGVALTNLLHRDIPGASTSCGTWIEPWLDELDVSTPPDPPDPPDPDGAPEWFLEFIAGLDEYLQDYLNSTPTQRGRHVRRRLHDRRGLGKGSDLLEGRDLLEG